MEMGWRGVSPLRLIPSGGLKVKGNDHALDLLKNNIRKTFLMLWLKLFSIYGTFLEKRQNQCLCLLTRGYELQNANLRPAILSAAHSIVNLPSSRPRLLGTSGHTHGNGMDCVSLLSLMGEMKGEKVGSQIV